MADDEPHVKRSFARCAADFVDCHPRSGWYIGAWMFLVTAQAVFGWIDLLVSLVS